VVTVFRKRALLPTEQSCREDNVTRGSIPLLLNKQRNWTNGNGRKASQISADDNEGQAYSSYRIMTPDTKLTQIP
jgi:hypothetical protein